MGWLYKPQHRALTVNRDQYTFFSLSHHRHVTTLLCRKGAVSGTAEFPDGLRHQAFEFFCKSHDRDIYIGRKTISTQCLSRRICQQIKVVCLDNFPRIISTHVFTFTPWSIRQPPAFSKSPEPVPIPEQPRTTSGYHHVSSPFSLSLPFHVVRLLMPQESLATQNAFSNGIKRSYAEHEINR